MCNARHPFVGLLLCLSVSAIYPHPALVQGESGNLSHDPSSCSRDAEGMGYFAIGRRVLRKPAGNLVYMLSWPAKDRPALPVVKHPDEPEGCPDHPIQQAVYHLSHVSTVSKDQSGPTSLYADAVSVIVHGGTPYTRNTLFEGMCQTHPLRDFKVPGFVGCRKAYSCDKGGAYQATEYSAPDGTKIALDCRAALTAPPTN